MTKSNSFTQKPKAETPKPIVVADGVVELGEKHYGFLRNLGWYDLDPLGKKVRDDSNLAIILSNCYDKTTVKNLREKLEQSGWRGPTVGKVAVLDDKIYVKYKKEWYHLIPRPEEHRRVKETDDFYYCKLDGEIVPDYDNLYLALLNLYEIYKRDKKAEGKKAADSALLQGLLASHTVKAIDLIMKDPPNSSTFHSKLIVLKKKK